MTWITPRCFWISGTFFTISWVVRGLSLSFRALTFNCRHLENTNGLRDGSSDEMYDIRRLMKISIRSKIVLQMVGYRRHKEYHFGIGRVTRYFWGIWCSVDLPKTWCWTGLCHVVFFFFSMVWNWYVLWMTRSSKWSFLLRLNMIYYDIFSRSDMIQCNTGSVYIDTYVCIL